MANKFKGSQSDDIGSIADARRLAKLFSDMRTQQPLAKLLARMVAAGRVEMAESAIATIGHSVKRALDSRDWSNSPDGILAICPIK